ncbi:hypothetical protein BCR42DRAFT_418014 [Absidia repens]|uniref:Uncharacterized protein n=1 Tax=Absidia repens TaxID=90262 RepID=A0A1X2ICR7_9FUNG|nr:hypothetical protein BCR42DRAFT_418014 [Absidia repens]
MKTSSLPACCLIPCRVRPDHLAPYSTQWLRNGIAPLDFDVGRVTLLCRFACTKFVNVFVSRRQPSNDRKMQE